jgi:tetratricopeptide (TPR) repeat protein
MALRQDERNADYWHSYGKMLAAGGAMQEAIGAYRQALALDANRAETWFEMGDALFDAGRFDEARPALQRAAALLNGDPRPHALLGLLQLQDGQADDAVGHFRIALQSRPDDVRTRHNLVTALRTADEREAALAEADLAIKSGAQFPETLGLRAHLLAELGRFEEAVEQYDAVIAKHPGHLDVLETHARLLPQLGRKSAALDGYKAALLKLPGSAELWQSALKAAHDLGDSAQMLAWANAAESALGAQPQFQVVRATAFGMQGEHRQARDIMQALVSDHPDDAGFAAHLAHVHLCLHEPEAAEPLAYRAMQLSPHDQNAPAHLGIAWRLLGDDREYWLADYDRLVMAMAIDLPPTLADDLAAMHVMRLAPSEQSLRGGTQTRGVLFDCRLPSIQQLAASISECVGTALRSLPKDDRHPFLSRNSGAISFAGSWSVRLRSEGFHINHIHPQGWLSSALYVALPETIDAGHGALTFGVPDAAYGLDLSPRRVEVPAVGKLVIFPSYFWHGTLPFDGEQPRMTVAFDGLPG